MSLDEPLLDAELPCPTGATAASTASAALDAPAARNLSLLGCNSTAAAPVNASLSFTWQDLTVVAVSCIVIALIVVSAASSGREPLAARAGAA